MSVGTFRNEEAMKFTALVAVFFSKFLPSRQKKSKDT
jgi:hypothetical protein